LKLAAIDIGSNAARLLIVEVVQYNSLEIDFTKLNLIRIPLQLGYDVFQSGFIGEDKKHNFIETMKAFKTLMNIYKVVAFKACATSAMRDATNSDEIVEEIYNLTGIQIDIISGQEEASILYETHIAEKFQHSNSSLYIDVGGGSTELTMFANKKIVFKESFNIGTIRLLNGKIEDSEWDALKDFIKKSCSDFYPLNLIGSGGNINKVFSMSNTKNGKPLKYKYLSDLNTTLSELSLQERVHQFQIKEDRAAVLVPALEIFTSIMRWTNATEIFVPKIGLADGLVKMLYSEMKHA
jgi:exopolyphosphatase/guanosine-5'-triphosphate,3'-diphosphate pyrophosphatase